MARSNPKSVPMERLLRALADPTRLRVLNLMAEGELCVCHLVDVLGITQPNVSRHLAYLRSAGLVEARRQGTWMHYRTTAEATSCGGRVLREVLACIRDEEPFRRDRIRLQKAVAGVPELVQLSSR